MPEEWHPQPAPPSIGSFPAMAYPAPYGPAERASLLRQLCRRAADQSADDPPEPHTPARRPLSPHFPGGGKGPPLPTVIPHRCTAVVLPGKSGQRRGLPPSFTGTGVKCRRLRRIYGPGGGWIIPAPRRAPATAGDPAGASLSPLPPHFLDACPALPGGAPLCSRPGFLAWGALCPVPLFSSHDKVPDRRAPPPARGLIIAAFRRLWSLRTLFRGRKPISGHGEKDNAGRDGFSLGETVYVLVHQGYYNRYIRRRSYDGGGCGHPDPGGGSDSGRNRLGYMAASARQRLLRRLLRLRRRPFLRGLREKNAGQEFPFIIPRLCDSNSQRPLGLYGNIVKKRAACYNDEEIRLRRRPPSGTARLCRSSCWGAFG